MKTAVEFLIEQITDSTMSIREAFKQAKEMEKQQIMDAIKFTIQDEFTKQTWKNGKCSHDIALNYYNNRFNK